jgi:hypothetical protein
VGCYLIVGAHMLNRDDETCFCDPLFMTGDGGSAWAGKEVEKCFSAQCQLAQANSSSLSAVGFGWKR